MNRDGNLRARTPALADEEEEQTMNENHRIIVAIADADGVSKLPLSLAETVALIQQQEPDMWVFADGQKIDPTLVDSTSLLEVTDVEITSGLLGGGPVIDEASTLPEPPERAGQPWPYTEDLELIERLENRDSIDDIAEAHGRSVGAIRSRIPLLYNEEHIEISSLPLGTDAEDSGFPKELTSRGLVVSNILIIGAGGIGGNLAERLSRAVAFTKPHQISLTLMDGDCVEERNLPHQPFAVGDLGKPKVEAIVRNLRKIGITDDRGVRLIPVANDFLSTTDLSGYDLVVAAVDCETPRRLVRENAERWLDLRATGDGCLMFTHEAPQSRINSIPSDENAPPASCQRSGAIESGRIQFGFSEAASHGAEWIVQWLNGRENLPSSRMYYIRAGQRTFPSMITEEAEE